MSTVNHNSSQPKKGDENSSKIFLLSKSRKVEIKNNQLLVNGSSISASINQSNTDFDLTQEAILETRKIYKEWINHQPNFNIIFLSGAGTSYGVGKGKITGKTLNGLWEDLEIENQPLLAEIKEASKYTSQSKDLEALLTRAYRTFELTLDQSLKDKIDDVEKFINAKCSLEFEEVSTSAHSTFLNKITKRKVGLPRIKIFTLNYDTLFEQAASDQRFTLIDGFSFSSPRYFFAHSYDHDVVLRTGSRLKNEDNFIKKVFHLYKLHGSIDWIDTGKEILQYPKEIIQTKLEEDKTLKRVLIYPRDNKFELSYEQPYFELIGRLQQALRTENTFLLTSGFSFNDKHIRSIIIEALKQNPSLHLLASTFPNIVEDKELQSFAEVDNRIMLIAETFKDFATNFPDNQSFSNDDPLDLIVTELAKKLKTSQANAG